MRLKIFFAALLGLAGTVVFLPASIGATVAAGSLTVESITRRDFQAAMETAPLFLWGLSGIVGLLGFWVWFFMRRQTGRAARLMTAACVLAGVVGATTLAFRLPAWPGLLALAGSLGGGAIFLWLVLPNLPLNPDARRPPPAR